MTTLAALPQQVNLFNPALLPTRERFSARQLVVWVVIAALALGALGWWAISQTRLLRQEMAAQQARAPSKAADDAGPTPQQIAALEQILRDRVALLEARRAARDASMHGMAGAGSGPSHVMRAIAETIPAEAWLTELRVVGARIDVTGKALDPAAADAWLERLRRSGLLAERPAATVRLERIDAPAGASGRGAGAYVFHLSAALASAFADEGSRP